MKYNKTHSAKIDQHFDQSDAVLGLHVNNQSVANHRCISLWATLHLPARHVLSGITM